VPLIEAAHFKEFTASTDESGISIHAFNSELLQRGIQGGHPIDKEFPEFGNSALICVTEIHSKEDIDKLVAASEEIIGSARRSEKKTEKGKQNRDG
jgi:glycine dehydrogenase subunit 1